MPRSATTSRRSHRSAPSRSSTRAAVTSQTPWALSLAADWWNAPAAACPDDVATLDQYHDVLRDRVRKTKSGSQRTVDILDVIITANGDPVSTQAIGEAVGIDPTGGHFSNTIGPLSTLGFIKRERGTVRLTEILFPEGLK